MRDFLTAEQRRPVFGALRKRAGRPATVADLLGKALEDNPAAQRQQQEDAGQLQLFENCEREETMTYTIEGVEIHTNGRGVVLWMSDWARANDLARLGYLRRESYRHLYGHCEYIIEAERH